MERLYVLAPALLPSAYVAGGFILFTFLSIIGRAPGTPDQRTHSAFFGYFIQFFVWILIPFERTLVALKVSPNSLTMTSLVVCAGAAVAIGTGHMATAGWLYIAAGGLDILDGRLARAQGRSSRAGAFLDSVADRWCEMFVFSGFAWFLRDTNWLLAALFALVGSVMVSYTRARGEGLSVKLDGGNMQRPERITIVALATLVTAWFGAASDTAQYSVHVIGVALFIVGAGSAVTAVGRFLRGYRALRAAEGKPKRSAPPLESEAKESPKTIS